MALRFASIPEAAGAPRINNSWWSDSDALRAPYLQKQIPDEDLELTSLTTQLEQRGAL